MTSSTVPLLRCFFSPRRTPNSPTEAHLADRVDRRHAGGLGGANYALEACEHLGGMALPLLAVDVGHAVASQSAASDSRSSPRLWRVVIATA